MELFVKYLHEILMFTAVTVSMGTSLLLHRVSKSENLGTIRAVFGTAEPFLGAIAPLYGVGTLLGLAAAWVADIPLLQSWLVVAYGLTVVAGVIGHQHSSWGHRIAQSARALEGDVVPAELRKLLSSRFAAAVFWIDIVLIAVFVALMVFRPHLW